jgi:hypothetical protein
MANDNESFHPLIFRQILPLDGSGSLVYTLQSRQFILFQLPYFVPAEVKILPFQSKNGIPFDTLMQGA